ncbi:MAG: segregation/condensation protein A [Eubacteriaceae bacterium]|nr:segregation/condensation protein A [Eubacteriaceae bacterium]
MGYKVKLNVFEGPFDLLVYLIENAKMNIYDIRVSEITAQYLEYIGDMQQMDVSVSSDFMVLAAELIDLKSKMLLPKIKNDGEEDMMEDPRTELVARILEYKRFKNISEMLAERELRGRLVKEKPQEDISRYTDEPDEYLIMDIEHFVKAFNAFLDRKKKVEEIKERYERIERQKISAEQRRNFIKKLFEADKNRVVTFEDMVQEKNDKYDVALSFSSLMEMVKDKRLEADQRRLYGRIDVKATEHLNDIIEEKQEAETDDQQKIDQVRI